MPDSVIPKLAVIGLGLIGGSFARALRSAGQVGSISGYDPDSVQRDAAKKLGVIDHSAASAAAAVEDANLIVLAVPVLHTADALAAIKPAIKAGAVLTDVGSTKQSVLADACKVFGELPPWFVPGHPIAGTEKSGVAHSSADLFRNHRVVLTPHDKQDVKAKDLVAAHWKSTGARVVEMDAAHHDSIFAATSHLPHLLAYSFVDMLAGTPQCDEIFRNAGGGFRDFTRIASSSPEMWHDILRANSDSVLTLLERQISELQNLQKLMKTQEWEQLKQLFQRARTARERYLTQIE